MPCEVQVKTFLFHRKVMFRCRDIHVCVFLTILWFTKSVTSWCTWNRVHFRIYLLNHNSLTHQTWSIDRYKQGQYFFLEYFEWFGGLGLSFGSFFNLATCSNYSITNYVKFPVVQFFEIVNKGESKMVIVN